MINQEELNNLYNEVDLWIQNDENYYNEFNKVKYSSFKLKRLVNQVINNNDFSEYKTSIMYIRQIVKKLKDEYKND